MIPTWLHTVWNIISLDISQKAYLNINSTFHVYLPSSLIYLSKCVTFFNILIQ